MGFPLVSIVIPTHNRETQLMKLIDSINSIQYKNIEIIVIENNCSDDTVQILKKEYPSITVINNKIPANLSLSRNLGIKNSKGKYVLCIDDDNLMGKNVIQVMVSTMEKNSNVGMVGASTLNEKNPSELLVTATKRHWLTGITEYAVGSRRNYFKCDSSLLITDDVANCFCIRKALVKEVGFFDDYKYPMFLSEADYCERIRKSGYIVLVATQAVVWHQSSLSSFMTRMSPQRIYYIARNKLYLHKSYCSPFKYIISLPILIIPYSLYYLIQIIRSKNPMSVRLEMLYQYLRGILHGMAG